MSAPPGVLDLRRLHGGGGMSEVERKMQMTMAQEEDEEEGQEVVGEDKVLLTNEVNKSSSPLAKLPIEIIERILHFTILPSHWQISQVQSTDEILRSSIRLRNAFQLCLVCKQFDQLVRPKMYKTIHIAHRKIRSLLKTFQTNPFLASFVRDVHLSSHIWTSDVNEDMIAKLFVIIRPYCIRLRIGANESGLLPYLLHGYPRTSDENQEDLERQDKPAALQVLHITWRDEMDYDPRMIRAEEREEEEMLAETGEANSISARQTLITLFEHEQPEQILQNGTIKHDDRERNSMFSNLYHLTLDMYSQAQLDQLFIDSGYFITHILPILTFLRIELPLSVLQCGVENGGKDGRGALAHRWPTKRFLFYGRIGGFEGVESARVEELKAMVTEKNQKLQHERAKELSERINNGVQNHQWQNDQIDIVYLMPCMTILLRSLLTRFALNVHRNDLMLFSLLLNGSKVRETNWSTRSTVCAYILAKSLEQYLSKGKADFDSKPISFPLSRLQEQDLDTYWNEQWLEAEREFDRHLPLSLGGLGLVPNSKDLNKNASDKDIHVSILLKWPASLDSFFRYAAMA